MFTIGSRALTTIALVAVLASMPLTACAPASPPDGGEQSQSADAADPSPSDGGSLVDPDQDTRRTGPAVSLGGPPSGGQGLEVAEDGRWCEGVALFWDGTVPEGVSFTFEGITSDPEGVALSGDQSPCGSTDPPLSCIGLTLASDAQNAFCSVALEPTADFVDGTTVAFTGTLTCATKADCDTVVAREVDRGPAIVICDPATHSQGEECVPAEPTS